MNDANLFQMNRLQMQEALLESASMVDESVYTYVNDVKTKICLWSDNAVRFFGFPDRLVPETQDSFFKRIHPDDRVLFQHKQAVTLEGEDTTHDLQYRVRNAEGSYVLVTGHGTLIRDSDGNPAFFVGAIFNHGERAHIDYVSGLQNQNSFLERLTHIIDGKQPVSVLMVGISDFGGINDIFGYTYGNRVLREFAKALRWKADPYGIVYRLSGAKFALISNNSSIETLEAFYNDLRLYCKGDFTVDEHRQNLLLSAGLLALDEFELTDRTAYTCLNYAYRKSKENHQGDLTVFRNDLDDSNRERLHLINDVRDCVFDNCRGFYLCYQPIVSCEDGSLHGAEALVRWESPRYGVVPPNDFIPILENDILFPDLGKWILRQALTDGRRMLEKYPDFIMNVNLSYSQIERGDFIECVEDILAETGFPAENLCLEITERCRLLDMDMLKNVIIRLKSIGIRFALDDFGTGFSSLGALYALHADVIKIDRAFVRNICQSETDRNILRYVAKLAETYGARVCVEGVETQAMWEVMKMENIDTLQGYYFYRPVRYDAFIDWCEGHEK